MRDDFTLPTKRTLADRVGKLCSNPRCRQLTSGPNDDPEKSVNVGFAAHITAASKGGCRYDQSLTSAQRQSIENGIWLCGTCAKLIDSDPACYTADVLHKWKRDAENSAKNAVSGRSPTNNVTAEDDEWASKCNDAIGHLRNIVPRFFNGTAGPPGVGWSSAPAYGLVFPDLNLRQRIETYLIQPPSDLRVQPRSLAVAELRLRVVRETIQGVLDCIDRVKATDSELTTRLHIT